MDVKVIHIEWQGPFSLAEVQKKNDGGNEENGWNGEDYGLYQICGWHILSGPNTLLYVGQAVDQTFAERFRQHEREWLAEEKKEKWIFLGKLAGIQYTKKDNWNSWYRDVDIAEAIIIYKYTPNYNSQRIWGKPNLKKYNFKAIHLKHSLKSKIKQTKKEFLLKTWDKAPDDYTRRKNVDEQVT